MPIIPRATLKKYAPPSVGEARINHDDCPAGRDTKRRLYIRRMPGGAILAYCHHCGGKGYLAGAGPTIRTGGEIPEQPTKVVRSAPETVGLSVPHQTWVEAWGIIPDPRVFRTVKGRDAVAVSDFSGGGSVRSFTSGAPKWCKWGNNRVAVYAALTEAPCLAVLVEDQLSAIKIAQLTDHDAVCLYGMNMPPFDILDSRVGAVVWLDNDAPAVVQRANQIARRLSLGGIKVALIAGTGDPKRHTPDELNKVLYYAWKELSSLTEDDVGAYRVVEVCRTGSGLCVGAGGVGVT